METNTRELLKKEIESEFVALEDAEVGTPEFNSGVDAVAKLIDREIEFEKLEAEKAEKAKQAKSDKTDKIVKNTISVLGIAVPTVATVWAVGVSLLAEFDENKIISSLAGKSFFNKIFSMKS